jgi:hypothetical protein
MKINLACLTLAFAMVASSGPVADQSAGLPAVEKRIDALLVRMTLEEKVGQMTQHTRAITRPNSAISSEPAGSARS